ncbi:hypothetical protein GBAR_LOCUS24262, partial [Geodia barretti]
SCLSRVGDRLAVVRAVHRGQAAEPLARQRGHADVAHRSHQVAVRRAGRVVEDRPVADVEQRPLLHEHRPLLQHPVMGRVVAPVAVPRQLLVAADEGEAGSRLAEVHAVVAEDESQVDGDLLAPVVRPLGRRVGDRVVPLPADAQADVGVGRYVCAHVHLLAVPAGSVGRGGLHRLEEGV